MGPNGSGKSTLARALSGHPEYEVTGGEVTYDGKDLLDMDPDERAREGVFMAFQYPVEIAGVNNAYFLKAALNAKRKHHGQPELDAMEFMQLIKEKSKLLDIDQSMLSRAVNEGFSGGEKKRNEIFQMALLEPKLAILDETDSGLDIDALKLVAVRRQRDARSGARDHRRHALPAAARLHRARLRARAERRPDRQVRRQGAGARARKEGLRLDRDRRAAGWSMSAMTQVAEKLQPWLAAIEQRPQGGPRWLQDLRDRGAARFSALGFPTVRDEEWRFTNVAPIAGAEFRPTGADAAHATEDELSRLPLQRRRASHGHRERPLRAGAVARPHGLPAGVRVGSLAAAVTEQADVVQRYLGQLADFGHERLHGAQHRAGRRRRLRLHSRRRGARAAAAPAVRHDGVRDVRPDHVERPRR